jgi:hypothetical protein
MRLNLLSRFVLAATLFIIAGSATSDVFAQTNQLDKNLARKFPSSFCPLPTVILGTFVTFTGHIKLTFVTPNGYDLQGNFIHHQQKLDNVSIMEESWFVAKAVPNDQFCYSDDEWGIVGTVPAADLIGKPEVPFFDQFDPSGSECPWDETDGATITGGVIELGSFADGIRDISTSVVISGLTPNVPYVIHGDWSADEFNIGTTCTGAEICMQVTVDDLPQGCVVVPAKTSTWGRVKALFGN